MTRQLHAKQERLIEAVRRGLEGDAVIEFIHTAGYAIQSQAIVRFLRNMGGRGRVQDLIKQGLSNLEVLKACFPNEDLSDVKAGPPEQVELFEESSEEDGTIPFSPALPELYDTTKMTLRLPSDLYEALRLAAKAEGKTKTQLMIEILTAALSRLPSPEDETDDSD